MKDNDKQSDIISDQALERVMRDVFSGFWSPRLDEPDTSLLTQRTSTEAENQADSSLQSRQLQTSKFGS